MSGSSGGNKTEGDGRGETFSETTPSAMGSPASVSLGARSQPGGGCLTVQRVREVSVSRNFCCLATGSKKNWNSTIFR